MTVSDIDFKVKTLRNEPSIDRPLLFLANSDSGSMVLLAQIVKSADG